MSRPPSKAQGAFVADLLSAEAESQLMRWGEEGRAIFQSLLEEAGSDVQAELLHRALAAGHSAGELIAFAGVLRPLSDAQAYEACLPRARSNLGVVQRLRAEADPLYGYEQNHGRLGPEEPVHAELSVPPGSPLRPRPQLPPVDPAPFRRRELFDEGAVRTGQGESTDVGTDDGVKIAEDLLNQAGGPLGVSYRERVVDDVRFTLSAAVNALAQALGSGWPVPVFIGPRPGESLEGALVLQVQRVPGGRAFQLHNPFSRKTVWVNERDLLQGRELPLDDPELRRLTRVCIPSGPAPSRSRGGQVRAAPLTRRGGS